MSYQIRKATDRDIACLGAIESAADGLFPEGRIPSLGGTYPIEGFLRAVRNGLLLVAEADTVVVGFAVSEEAERALHLYVLAVHPNYGRRGIGKNLVVGVIEESRRRGLTGVTLTTFADLEWNGLFYEKLGFRVLAPHETDTTLASILSSEKAEGMQLRVAMLYLNAA
jgi:ribosomal protein S18 acetylase RimI-like enzyme